MGQKPEPPHELMYAVLVYSFSRPAPNTPGILSGSLLARDRITHYSHFFHFFHRTSELDAAFKLGSVQLPTPHSNAGFTGKVIVLLKIPQWLPVALRTHSKPSVKACRSGPCLLLHLTMFPPCQPLHFFSFSTPPVFTQDVPHSPSPG